MGVCIAPATEFSLKRSMIRYFNEMSIPLAHLFLGEMTYSNHFINAAKTVKIYVIDDEVGTYLGAISNIMPYRLDSRGGTFWISNLVVGVAIICYILQCFQ